MDVKKTCSKVLSIILAVCMTIGLVPTMTYAASTTDIDSTSKNVSVVQAYSKQLRDNNQKSDYSTGGFSWDTEGKTDSWRYFNGVMMDVFLMEGDTAYADAFYNSNINSDGSIKNYIVGELDSVPTARGLFDLLDSSANAEKYKKAIQYVYTQLEGQVTYSNCGGNYLHKQDTNGNPTSGWTAWNIGLDGLYMAEPFLMECANAIDNGKLTLTDRSGNTVTSDTIYQEVYNRFAWVAESMYDSTSGLYHHGWNASSYKGNDHFWGRGIGWYAVALVDVIDMMPATYQDQMKPYLTKLFDGMLKYQDTDTGMWYNVVNRGTDLSKNILETSVSSMMAYSLMKAYNKGYVTDSKYGQAGLAAFNGVVANKLQGTAGSYNVIDTYLKSGVGTTDAYYTANGYTVDEAKGTGALIMAATVANTTAAKLNSGTGSEQPEVPESLTDENTGVVVSGSGASAMTVIDKSSDATVQTALSTKLQTGFKAYDITLTAYAGSDATVSIPAPEGTNKAYYVSDDGQTVEEMTGSYADGKFTFHALHFSIYAVGNAKTTTGSEDTGNSVSKSGTLPGSTTYELVTDGQIEDCAEYLIVNTATNGTGYALRNQHTSTAARQIVTINNSTATISAYERDCVWKFTKSGNGYVISNGSRYVDLSESRFVKEDSSITTVASQGSNVFWLNSEDYYLRYSDRSFKRSDSTNNTLKRNLYLYKKTNNAGSPVTLTVTPASVSLKPDETRKLTASVLVDSEDTESNVITWSSSDDNVATVVDGVVTAVADGEAMITAELTSANGLNPTSVVKVEIPVSVTSKSVDSAVLTGNDAVTTRKGVEPDFSNVKLNVTYDDNSTSVITTENGLVITGYNINEIGVYYASISYQGVEYGTIKVTVEGNPYEGKEEAEEYPEYPADGAVRIGKTATGQNFNSTGVVQVELNTAGISVKQGVDVVLVVDVSNSMGWSLENAGGANDAAKLPSEGQSTKLDNAMQAATSFSKILLGDNTGVDSDNSVSFVTFAGYDEQHYNLDSNKGDDKKYVDSVMTVFTNVTEYSKAKTSFEGTSISGTANGASAVYNLTVVNEKGETLVNGANRGNTNYDYAFYQAQQAVKELQSQYSNYADSGRSTYVIFMTDGAPSHYNKQNSNGGSGRDYWPDSTTSTYSANYNVETNADAWTEYILKNDNTYANSLYNLVGGNFYAFGFDLAHGGFGSYVADEEILTEVLSGMVTDATIPVMATSDSEMLNQFYESMATQIKYAGTNAQVTDIVDSHYTLQTIPTTGTGDVHGTLAEPPVITVTAYDLYTKAENDNYDLIGTRKGPSKTLETVTFSEDGTEAYSDQLDDGKNIMVTDSEGNVTITAQYFTYTKDAATGEEKFVWTIGNITDKEVALSYYAYLEGSMEGTCEEGLYYTNESAQLEYVDINDKHATKVFPRPAVNWGGASTAYEFYLVNANGDPVDRNGVVVPWANRITIYGPEYQALNLNADLTVEATIKAQDVLPAGYVLYDPNAYYTVRTTSSDVLKGELIISEPSEAANDNSQSRAQTTKVVSFDELNYTQSHVAFGVRYELTPEYVKSGLNGDKIVIDYGKAIQADVLANDNDPQKKDKDGNVTVDYKDYEKELIGFTAYNSNMDIAQIQKNPGVSTYTSKNGTYTIITSDTNQVVQFQPGTMLSEIEKVFCVVSYTNRVNASDVIYLYEELDIIPATSVYYETDFAEDVFELTTTGTDWNVSTVEGDSTPDTLQNDGTIGKNLYGYDDSYRDDTYLSNGSSWQVEGQGVKLNENTTNYTEAKFSFTGTGFDLISRTGQNQGAIRVDIYSDVNRTNRVKSVTVLNKSETNLELYQIPVVSVEGLVYGTYYVTIGVNAAYTNTSYQQLNRGGEFFFDAVRIWNPVNVDDASLTGDRLTTYNAYCEDGEAHPYVQEIRDNLIAADSFNVTGTSGIVFVDHVNGTEEEGVDVSTYTTIGPNNEVYLTKGQAIAFCINTNAVPASVDIGAKSADGRPVQLKAELASDVNKTAAIRIDKTISSSTAQYYDLGENGTLSEVFANNKAYVFVTNTGDGILSLTDLKIAYSSNPGTQSIRLISAEDVVNFARLCMTEPEETTEPDYDIKSAAFISDSCRLFMETEMTVVTTRDVTELEIKSWFVKDKKVSSSYEDKEDGSRIWTVKVKPIFCGNITYTVIGYGEDGSAGAPATAAIRVKLF